MDEGLGNLTENEIEELRRVFFSQAYETVEAVQDLLLGLEADPEDDASLKALKRHIHTLKGDSSSIGFTAVGSLCHKIEDLIAYITGSGKGPDHDSIDLLLASIDMVNTMLMAGESGRNGSDFGTITDRIDLFIKGGGGNGVSGAALNDRTLPGLTEYQQLQIEEALKGGQRAFHLEVDIDPLCVERGVGVLMLRQRMEGLGQVISSIPDPEGEAADTADRLIVILVSGRTEDEIRSEVSITGISKDIHIGDYHSEAKIAARSVVSETGIKGQMLKIEVSKVDRMMNLIGELIIGRSMIGHILSDLEGGSDPEEIAARLYSANASMERTVSDLQMGIMKMRMVPVNHVFRKFPKVVRELSSEKQKKVRLDIQGRETELDKGIVDALGEPLAHIIRNMVDHGIERPEERSMAGKPEEGTITLRAYYEAARIVIEISDDGRGIDRDKLRQKAAELGVMSSAEAEKLSDTEAVDLIFMSGLSTAREVSETSGRGVGMEVVKATIEGLKGTIEIESSQGAGTTFRLRLPLTLAVIRALLFEAGGKTYAVPISVISEVLRVMPEGLMTVDGRDTLVLRDRVVSMIRMDSLFNLASSGEKKRFALILGIGGKRLGLLVDRIMGQNELVIKAVDGRYSQSGLIAGASILGDGSVVLILDAAAVFRRAVDAERRRLGQ